MLQRKADYKGMKRKRLNRVGPKGRKNARANVLLKRECERLGIDRCEAQFEGCWQTEALSFAHVAKKRELQPGELETCAIVACMPCHRCLDEDMSHLQMREFVVGKLADRVDRFLEAIF